MPHTFYWERRRLAGRTVRIMKLLFENTIWRSDSSQMCPFGQSYAPAGETPALPVRRSAAKRQKVNGIGRDARGPRETKNYAALCEMARRAIRGVFIWLRQKYFIS